MDINRVIKLYTPTRFFSKSRGRCRALTKLLEPLMDKDFIRQIDQMTELFPNSSHLLEDEVLICECFCVDVADIKDACKKSGVVDMDLLTKGLSLGQGCGSCLKALEFWQNKIF